MVLAGPTLCSTEVLPFHDCLVVVVVVTVVAVGVLVVGRYFRLV